MPIDMPGPTGPYASKMRLFGTFTNAAQGVSIPSHEGLAVTRKAPMSAA